MKSTKEYPLQDPDRYMRAVEDLIYWLRPDRYQKHIELFAKKFNPCTWSMEDFHLWCSWMGVEGWPATVFAYEVMHYWELAQSVEEQE